jgi:CheY-like chemotaxis protein
MKKILIAEDRPSSRELIRTVLEGCGYSVSEASTVAKLSRSPSGNAPT